MPQANRKHICNVCARSFVKAEHLHRHQRSHTGAKPFSCEECGQAFTRLDSLSRHQQKQGHKNASALSRPRHNWNPSRNDIVSDLEDDTEEVSASSFRPAATLPQSMADAEIPAVLHTSSFDAISSLNSAHDHNFFPQLTWPDSEALLQSVLNVDISSWPQSLEVLPSQYLFQTANQAPIEKQSPWLDSAATGDSGNGTDAVRNISQIISNLSSNLASEAETATLSTAFLDACLHTFFEQMTSVSPICHRPTFVFRDWTHPLLLNAIALGSLFMGQDIDTARGEVLWALAHTAVATSWHSLIQHRGPYDACDGVQLVTTALLGQTFAMLSGTPKLRSTAQIFHSLGFYWARQCGMYESRNSSFLAEIDSHSSEEQKLVTWRRWAAEEVQLRTLLGHYILDGQLTYFTGAPTCQRHTFNSLPFPSSDRLFMSDSLYEWMETLRMEHSSPETFQDFFVELFDGSTTALSQSPRISLLVLQVVLEGLQSLVTDSHSAGRRVVGNPSPEAIERVLFSMNGLIQEIQHMTSGEKLQLLLRWHTICIDKLVNFNYLFKNLCLYLDIQQNVSGALNTQSNNIDFPTWTRTRSARKALLHSVAIRNILGDLPVRAVHATHIPSTLLVTATIHIAFVVGGASSITLPRITDWSLLTTCNNPIDKQLSELEQYLSGVVIIATKTSACRNILYDVNSLLLLTKHLHRPWAICNDIGAIIHQMCNKCRK